MRRLLGLGFAAAAVLVASGAGTARAAEITDVASSFDEDNPFDLRLRVGYSHYEKRARIKRELEGEAGQETVGIFKDLAYFQTRDTMDLRLEIGVFQDLMIFAEMPFVIGDSRELRYDQGLGSQCLFPGDSSGLRPTCVNADNSTTIADGIVPRGGFDALNQGANFAQGSNLVFRGPKRGGGGDSLDVFNIGITYAILSQKRDDTKPTWTLSVEGHFSIGNVMKFDRAHPEANRGVSDGTHHFIAKTSVSRRFRFFEPFIAFWYDLPLARSSEDTLFLNYGPTQKNEFPQQMAGTRFGIEAVPWENKAKQYKIAIMMQGRVEAHFDGRGYSEIWEMLAGSPPLKCDKMWNPACDPTLTSNKYQPDMNKNQDGAFTGLTTISNFATLGADAGILVQAGKFIRFHAGFQYTHDQPHFLTVDDVGKALDTDCKTPISGGRVHNPCEFNPAYRPVINQVGRRYRVDNVDIFNFGGWAQVMF